jgi:hypothetical protein
LLKVTVIDVGEVDAEAEVVELLCNVDGMDAVVVVVVTVLETSAVVVAVCIDTVVAVGGGGGLTTVTEVPVKGLMLEVPSETDAAEGGSSTSIRDSTPRIRRSLAVNRKSGICSSST